MPSDGYLHRFVVVHELEFPNLGYPGSIFVGAWNYTLEELEKIEKVAEGMEEFLKNKQHVGGNNSVLVGFGKGPYRFEPYYMQRLTFGGLG